MILYTPIPYEHIFPYDTTNRKEEMTVEIDGGWLVVEPVSRNEYKIVRLITSDPELYLKEKFTPGNTISLTFELP